MVNDDGTLSQGKKNKVFSDPDDVNEDIAIDHPATDSNIDTHEAYDEGTANASEVHEFDNEDERDS